MKKILFMTFIMIILTANIAFGISIVDVACGLNHTVLLAEDGTVWTMGDNSAGQCGQAEGNSIGEPKQIKYIPKIIQIDAAGNMTMLLDENGNSYLIGNNERMSLFATDCTDIAIAYTTEFSDSDHVYYNYAAVREDGTVYVSGDDYYGQLGLGSMGSKGRREGYADVSDVVDVSWVIGYHSDSSLTGAYQSIYDNPRVNYLKCIDSEGNHYRVKLDVSRSSYKAYMALEETTASSEYIFEITNKKNDLYYYYSTIKLTDTGTVYLDDTILYELYAEKIVKAGIGANHFIFVDDEGKAYGMGSNSHGQLGLSNESDEENVEIKAVETLEVYGDYYSNETNSTYKINTIQAVLQKGNLMRFIMYSEGYKQNFPIWNTYNLNNYFEDNIKVPTLIESLQEIVPNEQSSLAYMTSDARVWIGGIANFSLMFEVEEDMTLRNTGNNLQDIFTNGALNIKVFDWNKVNGQDVQITSAQGCVYNVYENGVNITQTITPNFVFKRGKVYQLECGIGGADVFVERGKTYTIKFEGMNASKVKDGVVTQMRSTVDIAKFVLRVYVTELANLT